MIRHLAAIMDGNRRWASKNKFSLAAGYSHGSKRALQEVIEFCLEKGILYLSLYTFSLENFYRSPEERNILFSALLQEVVAQRDKLIENSIAVRFVGKLELLPQDVLQACKTLEQATAQGNRLHLTLLVCYGGQQEILAAVKKVALEAHLTHDFSDDQVQKIFEKALWNYPFPVPELIIRTGGMKRLSNFLPYQSVYSELVFLDILWPEITKQHCQEAYDTFQATKRNFGR